MKDDIYLLYEDVNQLLNDICQFLSEEVKNDKISLKNRNVANKLIERSKMQLQNISRVISLPLDSDSGSYMDMNKKPEYLDPDKKLSDENQEIYSDPEYYDPGNTSTEGQIICPYECTPAQELQHAEKCGYLDRKDKFLFIEHQKRIYAAVCHSWMLIYPSEKHQKPNDTLYLRTYDAKPSNPEKKDEKCFELISAKNAKSYHFTATTTKDMLQWLAAIDRKRFTFQSESSTTLNSSEAMQNEEKITDYMEDENIYEKLRDDELKRKINNKDVQTKSNVVPSLPPRIVRNHYIINRPIPEIPTENKEELDQVILQSTENSSRDETQSFSDDDSENIYDMLITDQHSATKPISAVHMSRIEEDKLIIQDLKSNIIETVHSREDEEDPDIEYDLIQKDEEVHTKTEQNISKVEDINVAKSLKTDKENTLTFQTNVININVKQNEIVLAKETEKEDAEEVYDFIQTGAAPQTQQSCSNSTVKNLNEDENLNDEEEDRKTKPVPKKKPALKPKLLLLAGRGPRPHSKIDNLVKQLTKKAKN